MSFAGDLSYLNQLEDNGAQFRDSGVKDATFQSRREPVRIRLWHTPNWQPPVTGGRL